MLEDEGSRDIYLSKLNWLISGNRKYFDVIVAVYLPGVSLVTKTAIADMRKTMPQNGKIILYGVGTMGKSILFTASQRMIAGQAFAVRLRKSRNTVIEDGLS